VNVSQPPARLNVVPPGYRLRLPGPAAVPERVRAALAQPVLNHRGPEFHAVLAEAAAGLRRIFGTMRDVFLFGSSGTGAMEAALANVLGAGDNVLVVVARQFGERFAAIAEGMGARVDRMEIPWGEAPEPAVVATKLDRRLRARVPRRIGDRAAHACALSHRDRRAAHQAVRPGDPLRPALSRMHPARSRACAAGRRRRRGRRADAGAMTEDPC
jgi:hypothetical protein